ncbi:hypothetical protein MTO96_034756 [Rhipicephalus appendiculatus]
MTTGYTVASIVVQSQPKFYKGWILEADAIRVGTLYYVIGNLKPGRQYLVRAVAHSDAGAAQADFLLRTTTLPASGSRHLPLLGEDYQATKSQREQLIEAACGKRLPWTLQLRFTGLQQATTTALVSGISRAPLRWRWLKC